MFQKFFKSLMRWLKINLLYDESWIMTWSMILIYWLYNSFALLKGFIEWIMSFLNFLDIMTWFCMLACIMIKIFWPLISPFFSAMTKGEKYMNWYYECHIWMINIWINKCHIYIWIMLRYQKKLASKYMVNW